jgi:hypothetical protein
MQYLQELPPVSVSFLIPIVVVAIRWGSLSALVRAVGAAASLTYFYNSPFYANRADSLSRVLGVVVFVIVSLVLGYLASRIRRDTSRAVRRENEIRDLYTFSQRISAAQSPAGIFEAMQQHLETLVGRKVLLFDSLGTLEENPSVSAMSRSPSPSPRRGQDAGPPPIARRISWWTAIAAALGWCARFRPIRRNSGSLRFYAGSSRISLPYSQALHSD